MKDLVCHRRVGGKPPQGAAQNVRNVCNLHGKHTLTHKRTSESSLELRFSTWACLFLCSLCVAGSDPSTSAQIDAEVILSLPSSARCTAAVFSSWPLFVLARCPEVKPSVSGSLEIPVPTLLRFHRSDHSNVSGWPTAVSFSGFLFHILKMEVNR